MIHLPPRLTCLKIFSSFVVFICILQFASLIHPSLPATERLHSVSKYLTVSFQKPQPLSLPQFNTYGGTHCIPPLSRESIKKSVEKHSVCSKYSPFSASRTRIATITAHFGGLTGNEHYTKAFTTHIKHALVHGTEVHVLCDKIIDDLWNKPAFMLNLLLNEMAKPESKRLEWLIWIDRDTLILDQCRPASSFLPSATSSTAFARWRRRNHQARNEDSNKPPPEVNLLATNDMNGLNNGIFLLRVSPWAISLFTAILAYRHYNPTVKLKFTEQSAMELVLKDDRFKDKVQLVPQHWFNAYSNGGPRDFLERNSTKEEGLEETHARRGDWLIHFAGNEHKDKALNEWADMLDGMDDVWETSRVQRDVSGEVRQFWEDKGLRW